MEVIKWKMVIKAFIIMVFNSLMLEMIKSLVTLLVSVETDMSCTLVGLEINKKCLSLLDIFL